MIKTKKELLTNIIIDKCKTLTSVKITKKDEAVLSDFIKNRLHLHGRNGYLFQSSNWYKKEYIPTNDDLSIQRIGFYVLNSNHIKNIFNRWLSEIKDFYKKLLTIRKIYVII